MKVLTNISQILLGQKFHAKDGRNLLPEDMDILSNAAIAYNDEEILWVGKSNQLPVEYQAAPTQDLTGHVVTPELVDSHTHLVFGGDRSDEYTMRLNGADYVEIAKAGGGILSTMGATNAASEEALYQAVLSRIQLIANHGVTTIEIKSGYSLTTAGEERLSRVIARLRDELAPKIQIIPTYLAAHAVPRSYTNSRAYMNEVVMPLLERLATENLFEMVDIFQEDGYFDEADVRQLFSRANELGLKLKIHADEFDDHGGARLAIEYGALSADHLLKTSSKNIKLFKDSATIATILPGTSLFLGKDYAPIQELYQNSAKVAIASDYNPGSCHFFNLIQIATMAAKKNNINQAQLWCGITYNAAHAVGLLQQGHLAPGMRPRFSFFETSNINQITYYWGQNFAKNITL